MSQDHMNWQNTWHKLFEMENKWKTYAESLQTIPGIRFADRCYFRITIILHLSGRTFHKTNDQNKHSDID